MKDSYVEFPQADGLAKVRDLLEYAKKLPLKDLCKEGDYKNNSNLRYPQTRGEQVVDALLTYTLHDSRAEDNPVIDEMMSILSQLDTGVNKPEEWQSLFALMPEIGS